MARVPHEPTELDPADLVEEVDEAPAPKANVKRDSKPKTRTRPPSSRQHAATPAPQIKISVPPPLPRQAAPSAGLPDADLAIAEARRRAETIGQSADRVALSRARVELGILLEVLKRDSNAALIEYRAAHASAPSTLAPIAACRRLTPLRPVAPALALLETELRATPEGPARIARLVELGRLYLAGGAAPEKAVQAFRDVLAAKPDHPAGLRGLERALRTLPRAMESTPTLEALATHLETMAKAWVADWRLAAWLGVERAAIYEKLRRPDAARAALEGAVALDPGVGPVRGAYTRHLIARGETQRLVETWSQEAALEGPTARAGRLLTAAARLASDRLEQVSAAIDLYRRAIALDSTPLGARRTALAELVRLYEGTGDVNAAIDAENELLLWADEAERAHRHRRLVLALEGQGRAGEVAEHARAALGLDPDDDDTRERLDRALAELGRHEQRVSLWTTEASRNPLLSERTAALIRAAGIAETDLGRPDLALVEMRAAWAIDPDNGEVVDAIARLLTPLSPPNPDDPKDPARARARIDFYSEAATKTSDASRKIAYLEKLAQIWEDEVRSPRQALEVYREVLAMEPNRPSAVLGLERTAARAGDARELFRALVLEADHAKSPTLERSLLLRAADVASGSLSDADTALDLVRRVLAKNAGDPLALRAAYRVHQRTGRHEEALTQLRLLLKHAKKGPAAFSLAIEIATVLDERLRRREEAITAYKEAHRIDPSHPLPGAEIRRIMLASEDFRGLADELVAMAATAPSAETRSQWLAEAADIHAERLDDVDRAIVLLHQARAAAPEDVAIAERLERAYLRQGKTGDLIALLDTKPGKTQDDQLALGLLLSEDRDAVRASKVLIELLAVSPKHLPAQRALEHALSRTERYAELASILRLEATTFETQDARLGAVSELVLIEDHRGIAPAAGAPSATDLLRALAPDDILLHESLLRKGLAPESSGDATGAVVSLLALASSTPDAHHAATFALVAALVLERSADPSDNSKRAEALRHYQIALEGWPECLTAARGLRRLAERLGDADALTEASIALGSLEIDARTRAERLGEAAEALASRDSSIARAQALFARALGEDPDSARAAHGLLSCAASGTDPGLAADAVRRALDRATQTDQVVRLGAGLAKLAFERLSDPTVAIEALRRVRKKAPGNVQNLLNLAEACASMKLWVEAADTAQGAIGITRDPIERTKATLLLAIAESQIPGGQASASRDAATAEKLAESIPSDARSELLMRLGAVHTAVGDRPGTLRVLASAVLHGGKAPTPLDLLTQAHGATNFDSATALSKAILGIVDRAKTAGIPVEPAWIVTLGKLEATVLSKTREGIATLKEAILLDPGRLESYEALAEVYASLGAHDESVVELLAILPDLAPRAEPDRLLPVLALLARECKLARRTAQATLVETAAAYLRTGSSPEVTIPLGAPTPSSLAGSSMAALLPPEQSRPWLDVAVALADVMPKLLRVDPFALGLAPRDKLPPRAPHPARALSDRFARAFGEPRFDLFVDAAAVGVPRIVPSDPPAIVLPRGYGDLADNEQAAGVCRLLVYIALNVPWLEDLGPGDLEGMLFGAMRNGRESWQEGALGHGADASAELWRSRIAKTIGRKHKRALEEIAVRTTSFADPAAFRQAVRRAAARAAYVLTGDLPSTLNHLLRTDRDLSQVARSAVAPKLLAHPISSDLLFYALGQDGLTMRRNVGTA